MAIAQLAHWRTRHDADGILWVTADRDGERSNVLSEAVLLELNRILEEAEKTAPTGLVISSAKPGGFILGADITEFDGFTSSDEVSDKIRQGQAVLSRLENLPCTTVAAVHGFCLGGGFELALCCDWILALNVDQTRLGFPEVKLGIFPALGGATRVTERIGGARGLELMLSARNLRAPAARSLGLVDELVDEFASLDWAARRAIARRRRRRDPALSVRLGNTLAARKVVASVVRRKTASKAKPAHYPAPFALIDLWERQRDNRRRMFDGEATGVGELMVGDTARALRRLFFLSERMKQLGKSDPYECRRVHVVGAGVMGGDIAAWCVLQGMEVTVQDRSLAQIEPALARAAALFRKRLRKRPAVNAAVARLVADPEGRGIPRADVVIEAIIEDADAKRALFAELEPQMSDQAVLATNTSALPLQELAQNLANPARLIGLHFFNPVAKMPLVEVVHDVGTDARWITRGCAFCTQINRFALPVSSTPGFLVNRVLAPYLAGAFAMLVKGIDKDTIDAAAMRFGMPMGPIELADTVGLDVCIKVADTLVERNDSTEAVAQLLQTHLDAGHLGRKSGRGFYVWQKGRAQRQSAQIDNAYGDVLGERLLKPFLLECRAVSSEGIVADDDLLDAGIVFGTGFAPFTGGPMQYLSRGES